MKERLEVEIKKLNFFGEDETEEKAQFIARLGSLIPDRKENDFARRAGISPSGLRGALKHGNPVRTTLVGLSRAGNVNLAWLATGEGTPERVKANGGNEEDMGGKAPVIAPGNAHGKGTYSRGSRNEEMPPRRQAIGLMRRIFSALEVTGVAEEDDAFLDVADRTLQAINGLIERQGDEQVLTQEDYDALVRIVAKLRHPDQTGPKGGENTA
jgi:hypothetical protein